MRCQPNAVTFMHGNVKKVQLGKRLHVISPCDASSSQIRTLKRKPEMTPIMSQVILSSIENKLPLSPNLHVTYIDIFFYKFFFLVKFNKATKPDIYRNQIKLIGHYSILNQSWSILLCTFNISQIESAGQQFMEYKGLPSYFPGLATVLFSNQI